MASSPQDLFQAQGAPPATTNSTMAVHSFYELYELLQFLKLGTLIGWRRKVRANVEPLMGGGGGRKRSVSGGFSSSEWENVVTNPADKGEALTWMAGEQLIVIQEASEMEHVRKSFFDKQRVTQSSGARSSETYTA